ncbi:HD domain-containing protein [Pediococcus acidilactici]
MSQDNVEQLNQIDHFVREKLQDDLTGHDYAHIQRVVKMAQRLMDDRSEKINRFVVLAAASLHDVIDEKVVEQTEVTENEVTHLLRGLAVSDYDIAHIFDIITHMSFSDNLEHKYKLSLEGQIVQDADRLDAIGAIGIARTFYYGGAHGHVMYDHQIAPRETMTHAEYRQNQSVINHFYEKLLKLKDEMNTPLAQQIAAQRTQRMESFLTEFIAEWNQEN